MAKEKNKKSKKEAENNNKIKHKEEKKAKKTKKEKKLKEENIEISEEITEEINEEIEEENSGKAKYVFIYIFMSIMIIAILALLFIIANEKYSLIYKNPIAVIDLEEFGEIKVELEPLKAPNTVNHFVKLIQSGYYDGKVVYGIDAVSIHFARNTRGEAIDPVTSLVDKTIIEDSDLDYAYEIDGEFEENNFKLNDIRHDKYVISLVRADYSDLQVIPEHNSFNSGTAMFKILYEDAPGMNGNYAAFGKVIEGQEIIDKLAERKLRFAIETEEDKADLNEFNKFVKIKSITVDTFGRKFKDLKLHQKFIPEEFLLKLFEDRW